MLQLGVNSKKVYKEVAAEQQQPYHQLEQQQKCHLQQHH